MGGSTTMLFQAMCSCQFLLVTFSLQSELVGVLNVSKMTAVDPAWRITTLYICNWVNSTSKRVKDVNVELNSSNTLPKFNSSPLKSYLPNRKVGFQPPLFRGYVKLWGCKRKRQIDPDPIAQSRNHPKTGYARRVWGEKKGWLQSFSELILRLRFRELYIYIYIFF